MNSEESAELELPVASITSVTDLLSDSDEDAPMDVLEA